MPHISVVIPVYKAEGCLQELYRRLVPALEGITTDFECIMVEDCGGDRSWEIICELAKSDPRIKGIQFSRNFGQHYGITAGLDYCSGDWAVVMDCDLQDRPEEIPRLYAKAQEGYDVVLALRGRRHDPALKRLGSWFFYRLFSWLADIEYDGDAGNFRIISRKVVDQVCSMRENLRFFGGLIHWLGFPTATVEVRHDESFHGESTYTLRSLLSLAGSTIIAFSDKPLRMAIHFGFGMSLLSFCIGLYVIVQYMVYGIPVAGWSSLMVSIYFIGGIIISILGVMGIYLGKTFNESKRRPLYVISKSTFANDKAEE